MSRLWLVRHGPTHARVMVGWSDIPADLSDTAALARVDAMLPRVPVVSSDLVRAVATADALAPRPRLPHERALREIHFGRWEMRSWDEAGAEDPALARAFLDTPGPVRAPGGESWDDLTARVAGALARLTARTPELIVVAHFGVIVAALRLAGGLSAAEALTRNIAPLSVALVHLGESPRIVHESRLP